VERRVELDRVAARIKKRRVIHQLLAILGWNASPVPVAPKEARVAAEVKSLLRLLVAA